MSQQLPDGQTAYQNLFDGIYQRVFFQKCAHYGLQPRTQKQAEAMLNTAATLRNLEEQAQEKHAHDANDPIFAMQAAVERMARQQGVAPMHKQAEEEQGLRQVAADLFNDPLFYNSALGYKVAQAQELEAYYSQATSQQ
jgi:hypothetical protein